MPTTATSTPQARTRTRAALGLTAAFGIGLANLAGAGAAAAGPVGSAGDASSITVRTAHIAVPDPAGDVTVRPGATAEQAAAIDVDRADYRYVASDWEFGGRAVVRLGLHYADTQQTLRRHRFSFRFNSGGQSYRLVVSDTRFAIGRDGGRLHPAIGQVDGHLSEDGTTITVSLSAGRFDGAPLSDLVARAAVRSKSGALLAADATAASAPHLRLVTAPAPEAEMPR